MRVKPCPTCGKPVVPNQAQISIGSSRYFFRSGKPVYSCCVQCCGEKVTYHKSIQEAVEAWNRGE